MSDNPLVSIIVRTKDRPELLKKALRSIAAQTYRPIEVVLINDGGCDLDIEELKGILGDVSLNYIRLEKNTGRAHAGNVGIENARGEYIGFLDDDDEFYPEHVETLVTFMIQNNHDVAYTASEFVEKKFNKDFSEFTENKKWIFGKEFSYRDLIIANYIPLISLLFRSNLLRTFKFDESFELYEDWDALIRIGETVEFHFINKITTIYNQWSSSQIAFKSSNDFIRQATLKLYNKHREKIPIDVIFDLREDNFRKDFSLIEKDTFIRKLQEEITDLKISLDKFYKPKTLVFNFLTRFLKLNKK